VRWARIWNRAPLLLATSCLLLDLFLGLLLHPQSSDIGTCPRTCPRPLLIYAKLTKRAQQRTENPSASSRLHPCGPFEASAWRFSRDNTTSAEHYSTPFGEEARGSFHFPRLLEHQPLALVSERHGLRLAQKQDPARGLVLLRSATSSPNGLTARTLRLRPSALDPPAAGDPTPGRSSSFTV
jgi:hypothetical protein